MDYNPMLCKKCGALKMDRPDHGLLCSECERKMAEEFATRIRPDIGEKGKVEIQWVPEKEVDE